MCVATAIRAAVTSAQAKSIGRQGVVLKHGNCLCIYIYIYILYMLYIYIYMERERAYIERERDTCVYMCIYV